MRKMGMILAVACLLSPALVLAEASVVQNYCEQWVEGSDDLILVHFTIVNFSLPVSVCDLHLIPEPQPVPPECEVVAIVTPPGWSGALSPDGGADFFANTPGDCIDAGSHLSGFGLVMAVPDWCCFVTQFTGPAGEVLLEQEECFSCTLIPNEERTWGSIKALYN